MIDDKKHTHERRKRKTVKIAFNRYSQLNESDLVLWPTRASSNKDRVCGMRYKYDETKAKNSRYFHTNDAAQIRKKL